jgi:phage tail sheath protein FI
MPEYLAPGVYVEEIDTGTKPIEGVSTSTAGMVGVTERGPVDVPILVTSYGEYTRWFGERLNVLDFSNGPNDMHCYLPHAIEGFFVNGGKRVYVTRILDTIGAARAAFDLHDRGSSTSDATVLLRPAREGDGSGAAPPIYVLDQSGLSGVPPVSRIRIGDGSDTEYRTLNAAPGTPNHVAVNFPLNAGYAAAVTVHEVARVLATTPPPNSFTLAADSDSGVSTIDVTVAAIADINQNDLLEIGGQFNGELRFVRNVSGTGTTARVTLDSPLVLGYAAATAVVKLNPAPGGVSEIANTTLSTPVRAGESLALLTAPAAFFTDRNDLIIFNRGDLPTRQARRIGDLHRLTLSSGAYQTYPASAVIEEVTFSDSDTVATRAIDANASAGTNIIHLNDRSALAVGDLLRIGATTEQEFATVIALPNQAPGGAPPDAGNVVLSYPLGRARTSGTIVQRQGTVTVGNTKPSTVAVLDANQGSNQVVVSDGGNAGSLYAANDIIRITSGGDSFYHLLLAAATPMNAGPVTLNAPLTLAHPAGSPVTEREPMLMVQALDAGAWGNRLRVSVEEEDPGLVPRTTLAFVGGPTQIRLASAAGVERGTILELINPITNTTEGDLLKVANIDRATNTITLQGGLSAAQLNAIGLLPPGTQMIVRSREFRLTVFLLRQPDPSTPTRNLTVLDSESFRNLSLDPRHSRYAHKVIGTTFSPLTGTTEDDDQRPLRISDRRSEGESLYVRVRDLAQDLAEPDRTTALESARVGPETLTDLLPDGRRRAARHPLSGGNDSVATLTDATYIGADSATPENRTGLHSLRNIEEISIVACPGRTSVGMQSALIVHCELMRYRFAVLDGPRPPRDTLSDVQTQRQMFDTKYAALYHPWLLVPDPYPLNLARIADYAIPPSGHLIGIYARTDIERGVHKAPANEVVRGITGLQRVLNKEQQDILNPFPVNINVIRDFRDNNRGIRVFGGRVITSDSDWKYVNVRRLLIFIEASIDRGLQWVVFEPNAEPLWARVRRSISNFLTLVWRNGGLEGTKPEEAYFVKCDRTTMTQTDIDSGRLIVIVGVAPVKPAEFVIVRIGLWTARAE